MYAGAIVGLLSHSIAMARNVGTVTIRYLDPLCLCLLCCSSRLFAVQLLNACGRNTRDDMYALGDSAWITFRRLFRSQHIPIR